MSLRVLESVCFVTLFSFLLKWGVSLYPYSGAAKPPMYGDYEAQRHWQEITLNLEVKEWYKNSSSNDLMYWGLDYPPLTAYHSLIVGHIANYINPKYVALEKSRGYESYDHKLFMRYTVFFSDLFVYLPSVLLFLFLNNRNVHSKVSSQLTLIGLLFCPSLMLIDYGHFQYNNVSLGLFVAAVSLVTSGFDCIAAVLFSLALNYKQMELYHALPFFCYLLGKCFKEESVRKSLYKLFKIGGCVIITFLLVFLPFLSSTEDILQVVSRVFPLNRGLFEDKVANIWCCLSVFIKFKEILDYSSLALLCLICTAVTCLPSCINLLLYPTSDRFKYSLVNVSFIFFLLSYHVHEKSILLVLIPSCFMFGNEPFIVIWLNIISQLSMLPLLDRDGLFIPYVSLTIMSLFLYHLVRSYCALKRHQTLMDYIKYADHIWLLFKCSIFGVIILTLSLKFFPPPARYPDLFPMLISLFSCFHFVMFAIFFHLKQFSLPSYENKVTKIN